MQVPVLNLEDLKAINFSERIIVENSGEDYCFTTSDIINKLGDSAEELKGILSAFGEETIICRLFLLNEQVYCAIPKIYRDEFDKVTIYDAQNNPQPIEADINFVSHSTELILQTEKNIIIGQQLIIITTQTQKVGFKVPFGVHSDFESHINEKFLPENPSEIQSMLPNGKGIIPAKVINYYPRAVKPLSNLEVGETFIVTKDLGLDPRRPGATRYCLQKVSEGQEIGDFFEVWANYSLRQHYQQYGERPCTIISIEPRKNGGTNVKFARADLAKIR